MPFPDSSAEGSSVRRPEEMVPSRIGRLARLPLFFGLENRPVLLAGGSEAALWKAELLLACGAQVIGIAEEFCSEFTALEAGAGDGRLVLLRRAWEPADLAGKALAIGAIEDKIEGEAFAGAARAAGVPVNVVDKPALCDFAFGSIVNRSPLVIGISTDGAVPVLGQAVRSRIEAMLPAGLAVWAAAAKAWRSALGGLGLSFRQRRDFWERFSREAFARPDDKPDDTLRNRLLSKGDLSAGWDDAGSVVLVGAGPGDPDLLTLKAVRALQSADVILFDDLVSAEVLEFARREAKRILVGKRGARKSCSQADIQTLMLQLARQGKRVVRLKSGDPMVFGRAGEEIAALRAAGIAVSVIPGVTSAQGMAATLGVSLTHRDLAQSLVLATGHSRAGALPQSIDWQNAARGEATMIIYMGGRMARQLWSVLQQHGADPAMPVVAVASVSRPDQVVWAGHLADIEAGIASLPAGAPVLIGLGRVFEECQAGRATLTEPRRERA